MKSAYYAKATLYSREKVFFCPSQNQQLAVLEDLAPSRFPSWQNDAKEKLILTIRGMCGFSALLWRRLIYSKVANYLHQDVGAVSFIVRNSRLCSRIVWEISVRSHRKCLLVLAVIVSGRSARVGQRVEWDSRGCGEMAQRLGWAVQSLGWDSAEGWVG